MAEQTFGQAFREARKAGKDKFQYKGNWYTTQTREEKTSPTQGTVEKGNIKAKKSNGQSRYTIRRVNGNQFAVYDTQDSRYIGNAYNSADEARKYVNSDQFKQDSGIFTATAARTKITGNTAGFIPVKEAGLFNKDGQPRVYKNYSTGQYFVVDNYGNIVGDSMDPNAGKPGFTGWIVNTGSKGDMKRAGQAELKAKEDLNEVNQLSQQKKDRQLDERERQLAGIRGMQGMANTIQSMMNMPNHAIVGLARTATSPTYTMDDYLRGFTIDGMYNGQQSIGLGDLVEAENPLTRAGLNFINPLSIYGTRGTLGKSKGSGYSQGIANHTADAHIIQQQGPATANSTRMIFREVPSGRIVGNVEGKGKMLVPNGQRSNGMSSLGQNRQVTRGNRILSNKKVKTEYPGVGVIEKRIITTNRPSAMGNHIEGITTYDPRLTSATPINFGFRYDPKQTIVTSNGVPTANFYYDGEWNPTVMGRIQTGDFVPGTTSPNWDGTIRGGNVEVVNTRNHTSPSFGGTTAGGGRDNQSNWYLYGSR